ncbi:terminase small subunit [Pseudodesulfovibrio tunisiensis]|uniref:terminase small subunit n=1 Tax=Pseudodesulfovibrio tunisiensis TaxID=463192 RepID=UPI001FB43419|nr:terminase small subunit [Pseudodesulfovibrio tunisiensis]
MAGKTAQLTARQRAFVQEYLVDLNATQAAIRAGYSKRSAYSQGQRLLKKAEIQAAIREELEKRTERTQITQDYVLKNIVSIVERCMQAEPVTDRKGKPVYVENAAGEQVPAYTFDSHGALRGNELLGKHLGMFNEKVDHNVEGSLTINLKRYDDESNGENGN